MRQVALAEVEFAHEQVNLVSFLPLTTKHKNAL